MKNPNANAKPPVPTIRCAIYTRKSTEEGLEKEFNSLDAQRESGELFVRSQAGEGWTLVPDAYDDGGFTGGNMERPALRRLMLDIEAGQVDAVVVYKVDRLSRSLLDFARMMQVFDSRKVSFVSVTQQFNTATSMGRRVLLVLLSFAQFEREIISERTRDKIAATRRKGKWAGGHPILGYDVDPQGFKLLVNPAEAERVRAIFELYLDRESLMPAVQALAGKGWANKRWTTRKGNERGGQPFTRTSLYKLLTNIAYAGKVRYKAEVHPGEHPAVVEPVLWQRVQALLGRNGRTGGAPVRNKFGALLKGILRCVPCGCAMTPSHSTRQAEGTKRYRYYVCSSAQKRGWHTCPSKSIPAAQIEELVVKQIQRVGRDPKVLQEALAEARRQDEVRAVELKAEQREAEKDLRAWHAEVRTLAAGVPKAKDGVPMARLAEVQGRIAAGEERLRAIRTELDAAKSGRLHPDEAKLALSAFDPVWGALAPRERVRVVQLLVGQVDYDGGRGKVAVSFRPAGIKTLAGELATTEKGRQV